VIYLNIHANLWLIALLLPPPEEEKKKGENGTLVVQYQREFAWDKVQYAALSLADFEGEGKNSNGRVRCRAITYENSQTVNPESRMIR